MRSKLITISKIAELSGCSISAIRNYINGGYYNKGKFIPQEVDFPKPTKIIGNRKYFEESKVLAWFNLK